MNSVLASKKLDQAMQCVESWPEKVQEELAEIILEIDARVTGGHYHASREELAGIDRGLEAARDGRFATDQQVEAIFAKHRRR
jgi:predicted transcriptional regulator